jgi:hypothetical protein
MVSGTRAAHNVEITAESLHEELARLEVQKQALERELAAVVAHLNSVQRALSAIEALMPAPAVTADPAGSAAAPADAAPQTTGSTKTQVGASSGSAGAGSRTESHAQRPKRRKEAAKRASRAPRAEKDQQRNYGRLTEQILEYFAGVGDADVRARDVAAALGRDSDSGSINAVRSTLDRLVGSSRIRRAGRGLYRAQQS